MKQFCTFLLNDLLFGVDVLEVQEVILQQEMTHVPLASSSVRGLINLRGQIVTAIDLRDRMNLKESSNTEEQKNIVIQTEDGAVSLLVDEIGDVIEPDEASFEKPPENLTGVARQIIDGVYKLPNKLLLVLNTKRTVDLENSLEAGWKHC
tara:strand:- start:992 stop:1441 length:450 start_codon:yes stop_codon:yes gene_type:complete